MRKTDTAYTSRVSLYLKVANILRSRIAKGLWREGDRLPNIMSLCEEFNVGRVTVRQALQLLSEEGLIDSRRGRGTYVTSAHTQNRENSKTSRILEGEDQTIKILEIAPPSKLPHALKGNYAAGKEYVRIRKLRCHGSKPFCLMDIYVLSDIFDLFPKEELSNRTVAALIQQYSPIPIHTARQVLGINVADYETANLLHCHMAAPIAEVDRFFANADGELISRGHYFYRGDMFYMATEHMGDPVSDSASGWLPVVKRS
ncbi:GntR family transcriptional regulator [Sneathiella glossodoripedis]|uniref:GntR family transcriptional regulator n=1 Tax=Sneathiella glossodoripedis TaxID=418853 RepID=UPI0004705605|nr:GntR family transcriptional regulator [Sneathiella glossodoripedis]